MAHTRARTWAASAWAVCGCTIGIGTASAQITIRPVALSGQPAPGITDRTFSSLGQPVVGTTGQVWFTADLTGPGPGPITSLCLAEALGSPSVAFINATPVPGLGANRIWGNSGVWTSLAAGSQNELAFVGSVFTTDGSPSFSQLFVRDIAGNSPIMRTGGVNPPGNGPYPPGAGFPVSNFLTLALAPGGKLAIKANINSGVLTANTGIWSSDLAFIRYKAIEGQPAPGLPAGVTWGDFELGPAGPSITPFLIPAINSSEVVTFKAALSGAVTNSTNEAIWRGSPGAAPVMVAREGDPVVALNAPAGTTWLMFDRPCINAFGTIAFAAMMTGGGTTGSNDEAIFVGTPGNLVMLVREDDPAPGLQGLRLHERDSALRTFRGLVLNNAGQLAFVTGIASALGITNNNDGLAYVYTPNPPPPGDPWLLLGREGDAAPGAGPTDLYGNFNEIAINSRGQVAFSNALNNANRAYFAGPAGQHGFIARANGTFQVGPGDVRTIANGSSAVQATLGTGGADGLPACLSNAGTLIFRAFFTNGTHGVFEAALGPVPQPPGDRDADGLRDDWESGPMDINEDGNPDLNLAALGANPDHKDLFVEFDSRFDAVTMQPALDLVRDAFAAAPLTNPAGGTGVTTHFLFDDHIAVVGPHAVTCDTCFPTAYAGLKATYYGTVAERTDAVNGAARLEARRRTHRYAMILHSTTPEYYYGLAEVDGNDMVLILGSQEMVSSNQAMAGVIMHELGHMLGLHHGGADEANFKPNYPSVMNYSLAIPRRFSNRFWRLDYCRQTQPTVTETNLNETVGLGLVGGLYTDFWMPFGCYRDGVGPRQIEYAHLDGSPVDLGNIGGTFGYLDGVLSASGVRQDLNYLGPGSDIPGAATPSYPEVLIAQNDWDNVQLRIGTGGHYGAAAIDDPTGVGGEPNPATSAWIDANIPGHCPADYDSNGLVEPADVSLFVTTWFNSLVGGTLAGDFDHNNAVEPADVSLFVTTWFNALVNGC